MELSSLDHPLNERVLERYNNSVISPETPITQKELCYSTTHYSELTAVTPRCVAQVVNCYQYFANCFSASNTILSISAAPALCVSQWKANKNNNCAGSYINKKILKILIVYEFSIESTHSFQCCA